MTIKLKLKILLITPFLWCRFCQAQESVNSTGGDNSSSGGSISYSIGQIAYSSFIGSSGNIEQGVQHAYEIYNLGIKDSKLNNSIRVHPNPSVETISIEVSSPLEENLSYQFYNSQAQVLNFGKIKESETIIDVRFLPSAIYYVNILNEKNQKIQEFKIIKK
jgi:hypothetical protein